ncbi:MmgE/PrpD family protein [Actinophytocola sp.]|uniref:MmgE/PrpD family protein n=1 Tax=Actinophytocola sp. TaxID=1872138 RepID=UPI003D6C3B7B
MPRTPLAEAVDSVVHRAAEVRWRDLDDRTRDAALRLVMDSLGVATVGRLAPGVEPAVGASLRLGGADTVAGLGPADAAMVLSILMHAWDFDDVHDGAVVHAGSVVVPAALAAARSSGAGGERVLEGVVAGVELLCRLALAVGEQRGVVRTAGLGALGAAAAVARVLGLDHAGVHAALSLALPVSLAPTTRQAVAEGTVIKRCQPGFACRHGVTAAFLADAGVAASPEWFGGPFGIAAVVSDQDAALARLTSSSAWQVTELSLKPYPACRYAHAAISGTARLLQTVAVDEVSRLRVHVPAGRGHEIVARPWRRRGHPLVDAQFSIPWLCAAVLERGSVDLRTMLGGALTDPAIDARADTVDVVRDQPVGETAMTPVRVVAVRADGSTEEVVVRAVPGAPEEPLRWRDLLAKVEGCLGALGLDRERAHVLHDAVRSLPDRRADRSMFALLDSLYFGQSSVEVTR